MPNRDPPCIALFTWDTVHAVYASPLVSSFPLPPVFPRTISLDATRIKELTFVQVYIGTYAGCLEIREYEVRVCVYSGTRWYERENIGKY